MSSKRAERHRWTGFLSGLLIALVWVLAPTHTAAQKNAASPNKKDEACLACHGSAGMKSEKGKDISINPAKHAASAHAVLGCTDCHTSIKDFPHPAKIARVECTTCHTDEVKAFSTSVHSLVGETACASCHGGVHELATAEKLAPAKCTECHAQEVKEFAESIHGQAASHGDPDAPKCESCHGAIHSLKAAGEADSMVAAKKLADTCAKCHSDPGFQSRIRWIRTSRASTGARSPREARKRRNATIATATTTFTRPAMRGPALTTGRSPKLARRATRKSRRRMKPVFMARRCGPA
jgi:hypothetical protein